MNVTNECHEILSEFYKVAVLTILLDIKKPTKM